MPAITPRCPYCNAQGIQQLQAHPVGAFMVVFCGSCGAIHGVIPRPQQPSPQINVKSVETSEPEPLPQQPASKSLPELEVLSVQQGHRHAKVVKQGKPGVGPEQQAELLGLQYRGSTPRRIIHYDEGDLDLSVLPQGKESS